MITKLYMFNGKELSTLTEAEKVECRKEFEGRIYSCGLSRDEYAEITKLTEPAKKIDVATNGISNMMCIEYSDKDVQERVKESIETILKDVYGDD